MLGSSYLLNRFLVSKVFENLKLKVLLLCLALVDWLSKSTAVLQRRSIVIGCSLSIAI